MRTVAVICVITASVFIPQPLWAELHEHTLDQYQENQNYSYNVGDLTMMAQTFTAGLDGTLCHIQIGNTSGIYFGDVSPPVVQVYEGSPGSYWELKGSVDLSYPVPYIENGTWITPDMTGSPGPVGWTPLIDFNVSLTKGQMYSIVLKAYDPSGAVFVSATDYESYEAGALWANYDGDTWLLSETDTGVYDMQFRTYVVPVPLPAGVWLGICAMGVAGWHLKRHVA